MSDEPKIFGYEDQFVEKVLRDYMAGMRSMEIYQKYGVTRATIRSWLSRLSFDYQRDYKPPNQRNWTNIKKHLKK